MTTAVHYWVTDDNRYLAHSGQCLRDMRRQNTIGVHLRIVEEPVRGFELCARQRLRKRALRSLRQLTRQRDETLGATRIAQVGGAEFVDRPVVAVEGRRQCYIVQ